MYQMRVRIVGQLVRGCQQRVRWNTTTRNTPMRVRERSRRRLGLITSVTTDTSVLGQLPRQREESAGVFRPSCRRSNAHRGRESASNHARQADISARKESTSPSLLSSPRNVPLDHNVLDSLLDGIPNWARGPSVAPSSWIRLSHQADSLSEPCWASR